MSGVSDISPAFIRLKTIYLKLLFVKISPTNLYSLEIISDCDIVLISQVYNSVAFELSVVSS